MKVKRDNVRKESNKRAKQGKANSKEKRKYRWETKFLPALKWGLNIKGAWKVEVKFHKFLTSTR
jgi:hypothetical protein